MMDIFRQSLFFGAAITIFAFQAAMAIKKRFNYALVNPFLIASAMIVCALFALDISFESYNNSARILSFFNTPATVCLAVPLYKKLPVLKENLLAVLASITAGVLANAATITVLSLVMKLNHVEFASLLPKSVTTPIAIALSSEYGGIVAMTTLGVLVAGTVGNVSGEILFKIFKINHPVSRGLAFGASSHAIGTAKAVELGETEGAMSGLSIAVTGILTVVIAPFFANII